MSGGMIGADIAGMAVDDIKDQYQYENTRWTNIKFDSNKYQRMVKDLDKAGVNKLAYIGSTSAGGVSIPGGSSTSQAGISGQLAQLRNARTEKDRMNIERRIADADIKKKKQETNTSSALESKLVADRLLTDNQRSAIYFQNAKLMSDWMTNNALQGKYNAEAMNMLLQNIPLEVDRELYKGPYAQQLRMMEKIKSLPQFYQLLGHGGEALVDNLVNLFRKESARRLENKRNRIEKLKTFPSKLWDWAKKPKFEPRKWWNNIKKW